MLSSNNPFIIFSGVHWRCLHGAAWPPACLPPLTDCSVAAQLNASVHFQFCCLASDTPPPHPPAANTTSISLTLIQWASFSALVAVSLQELRVCPPSLYYVKKHFVHNRRLWPHLQETPLVCRPFHSKLAFGFKTKHDLTCLNSTFVCLENSLVCLCGANSLWSVAVLVLHRLATPTL